jgi:tetratricopeptide (TPR) repeat protein
MMPSNVHFKRGEVLCELQRFALAEQEFRQEIAVNPDFPDAYALLGWCLLQQGKSEALVEIQHAIHLNPQQANFHGILAVYWCGFRERDNARAAINEAIKLDPYSGYYFYILACIQVYESDRIMYSGNAKDIADKESEFYARNVFPAIEQSLALDPHDIPALNLYTKSLAKVGRVWEAIENSLRTLEVTPNDALTLKNHGMLLFEANNFAEAANYFSKALVIDPNLEEASNFLLRSKRRTRRLKLEQKLAEKYFSSSEIKNDLIEDSKYSKNLKPINKKHKIYSNLVALRHKASKMYYFAVLIAITIFIVLLNAIIFIVWNIKIFLVLPIAIILLICLIYFYRRSIEE